MAMTAPGTSIAPITLTLFGPIQVLVGGRPLPRLRSRKALWLLALLALRGGRAVEREWLAGMLWPDTDPDQALASLRTNLSELRKVLADEGERVQSPHRHSLYLDIAGAEVDVVAFDAAVANKTPAALARAVALYTGPLLEGCAEEWVGQERGAREQDCLTALQTLGDAALAARDNGAASAYYRRAVGLDPWAEAARRGLMEALAQGGDTNAALLAYRELVQLLRDDPKAAPDEQTIALYARLRADSRRQFAGGGPPPAAVRENAPAPEVSGYLPSPLTDLVGREDERLEVAGRLRRSRLVTLTGPGGVGKTRLSIAVAAEVVREFADGVWLVALDALTDGSRVPAQIAGVVGVKEETGRPLLQSLSDHLCRKRVLLVLDNCEHVLTACAQAAAHLLRECAGTRILATSRESLGIVGETAWAVPGLAVPDPAYLPAGRMTLARVLSGYEGIQLFVERAQAVQKTFELTAENAPAVAQTCASLGGIPLAIELAAARIRVMTAVQIAARLDDYLGLLTGSSRAGPSRQQTLRTTLDWSYSLLNEPERTLLARLSVFAGGWTLEASEVVCAGDGIESGQVLDLLTSLMDKSLIVFVDRIADEGGRYRLLEMVRQYAAERLEASGQTGPLRARHRDHFLILAEEARPQLKGPQQQVWLRRLETEHDNLRAALAWCEAQTPGAEIGLRLTTALAWFWNVRGYLHEGREHLRRALEREGAQARTADRANALKRAGDLAHNQSDYAAARALLEESLHIFRDLGDRRGIAQALNDLSNEAHAQGDYASARALLEEGLGIFRTLDDKPGIALILGNLGGVIRHQGDYASARALLEESLGLDREAGDLRSIALTLNNLGNVVRLQGDYALAWGLYEEALSLRRELQDKQGSASSLSSLGALVCAQGDHALAQTLLEESLSLRRELGNKTTTAWSLQNLGIVARAQGQWARAEALHEESLSLFDEVEDRAGRAWSLVNLGLVAHHAGDRHSAQARLRESLSLFHHLRDTEGVAASLREMATILAPLEAKQKAVRLWGAAQALRENIGAPLTPDEQKEHDHQTGEAAAALGEAVFSAAWAEGYALTWEQAAAYALEDW